MKRKEFIAALGLTPLLTGFRFAPDEKNDTGIKAGTIKPAALSRGDKVAIVAPATAVGDPMDLKNAREICDFYGFESYYSESYLKQQGGYKTRSIAERVDEIHEAFADEDTKAVMCIRGGYGSMGLLNKLDYDLIKNNPKVFTGYSDITAMHLAISRNTGLVTFHGPVLLSGFTDFTESHFKRAVMNTAPLGKITNPKQSAGVRQSNKTLTINSGAAAGRLVGGNLSLLAALTGTPYEADTDGAIFFIEEVGELPYRVERMLNQLMLAGKFDKVAGVVLGKCEDCGGVSASLWDGTYYEVVTRFFSNFSFPVFADLLIGHSPNQATLPIGIKAEMNADEGWLNITESAVI